MSPFHQYRAGGYGRQSKARANRSEVSTASQHEAARARSDQMGATWVGWYEDLGISAFSGVERPDFDRLIADCHAGRINLIIVYYISRLSRLDPLDAIPVVTDLLNRGVTIVSVTEGEFRRGDIMDLIHMIMRLDQAHGESKTKSVHVRGAKALARELGGYVSGKPPYGFALRPEVRAAADGRPIAVQLLDPHPAEAEVVRRMFARMLDPDDPANINRLVAELNNDQVPTRGATVGKMHANSVWRPRTVDRILRDPRVAGYGAEIVYVPRPDGSPSKRIDHYRITRDADGIPVTAHPAIVAPVQWFEVQARLGRRPTPAAPAPSLLSGLGALACECGSPMRSHRNEKLAYYSVYVCSRVHGLKLPGQHAGGCTISQRALDDYVARRIFALIATAEDDPDTLDVIAEATRRFGVASADPAAVAARGTMSGELDEARRALDELYDDRAAGAYAGTIGQARFRTSAAALNGRIEALTAQLDALDAAASPTLPIEQWLAEPGEDPIGPGSWWDRTALPERRAFVALFVARVEVRKAPARGHRAPVDTRVSLTWAGVDADG
ncbi:Site-specific DNA recombinase [Micromonospora nigra]|uniref:Site-specific DNA recombinase n=1 Tax=Micromonospora nigra TaxID=145857 RepID=A0A1C6SUG5_9ACTN|nr:recombinase family protein [Micromonospora nigra]SCL33108.1 Site-specific DNA recombinase [Micromonospora nigra]